MTLKAHVLSEAVRARHVLTLHRYGELFQDHIAHEAMTMLATAWTRLLKRLKFKLDADIQAELLLKHPKALTDVAVHANTKTAYGNIVSLAVKAPLALGQERLNILKRELLDDAVTAFKDLIAKWPEAFSRERPDGQLTTDFTIKRDAHGVRLCLCSKQDGVEHESTLLRVVHEAGKPNSKVRNFEQVYFSVG